MTTGPPPCRWRRWRPPCKARWARSGRRTGRWSGRGGFRITGLQTVYQNALGTSLNFTTTLTVEVPLTLGGRVLPPVARELEVHTTYEAKF